MTSSTLLQGVAVLLALQGFSIIILDFLQISFPAPLLGMIILTFLLLFKIIDVSLIESACTVLIEKMGMLFLPAGVSILLYLDIIQAECFAIFATIILTNLIILIVTAVFLEALLKIKERRNSK